MELLFLGNDHYYKFHNVENQKEHRKIWRRSQHQKALLKRSERQKRKRSEHQKCLLSSSLLPQKSDFRCSDFTYGDKKDHNVENQNINYLWRITYGYQGLWGVR
jgi:hypothetical protein